MVKFSAAKVDLQVPSIEAGLACWPSPYLPCRSLAMAFGTGCFLHAGEEPDKALAGVLRGSL